MMRTFKQAEKGKKIAKLKFHDRCKGIMHGYHLQDRGKTESKCRDAEGGEATRTLTEVNCRVARRPVARLRNGDE
jgi:hypothetical protein